MRLQIKSLLLILFTVIMISLTETACKQVEPKVEVTLDSTQLSFNHLLARADSLELDTPYERIPGDPLSHQAAGFAKIMCSAVYLGEQSQGCICLPQGEGKPYFKPTKVVPKLPEAAKTAWPMGDLIAEETWPTEVDKTKIDQAMQAAFDGEGMTAAFVVTYKGKIIAEKYGVNISHMTPLESWSMGKSLTATLMGILIKEGAYSLDQAAPIPEWKEPGDERAKIKIQDILHMSSGLRFRAPQDPDYDARRRWAIHHDHSLPWAGHSPYGALQGRKCRAVIPG